MASLTLSALCTLACTSFSLSFVFEGAAVRDDDAARILVEFDDLEGERFALDSLRTIGLDQVLRRSECFDTSGREMTAPFSTNSRIVPSWIVPTR